MKKLLIMIAGFLSLGLVGCNTLQPKTIAVQVGQSDWGEYQNQRHFGANVTVTWELRSSTFDLTPAAVRALKAEAHQKD
jgi:hypothetical protein